MKGKHARGAVRHETFEVADARVRREHGGPTDGRPEREVVRPNDQATAHELCKGFLYIPCGAFGRTRRHHPLEEKIAAALTAARREGSRS